MKMKVGVYFWVRVAVMCAALVGIVVLMYKLNVPDSAEFNACPTRVTSIAVIGEMALIQDGMTWYRSKGGERVELDQVAVEKWFSANCKVAIQAVSGEAPKESHPLVTFAYVSGSPVTLQKSGDIYIYSGSYFRSEHLTRALAQLNELPPAKKPGE